MFDFSRAREISRKITIEDDPVKIDKFLSNLHEIVSKEFEKRQDEAFAPDQCREPPELANARKTSPR